MPNRIDETRTQIVAGIAPLAVETILLDQAVGRVLRQEIYARENQPAFDRAAMDGYAVAAGSERRWKIVREIPAGAPAGEPLRSGECARIMTGAAVPAGAVRVLPQEWTRSENSSVAWVEGDGPDYIRRQGDDCRQGDVLLKAGTRLQPPDVAVLAQQGIVQLDVGQIPKVLHLATGDELVDAAEKPAGSQIRDTNSPLIAALFQEAGLPRPRAARVPDCLEKTREALDPLDWKEADLLLLSAGAGKSDRDIGRPLLEALGFEVFIGGVNLRPGKPFTAARRGKQLAFLLPGNPVSHWVVWHLFVRPCLDRLQGALPLSRRIILPLAEEWSIRGDRRDLRWPAQVEWTTSGPSVRPLPLSSSGDISRLAGANALIHLSPEAPVITQGTPVTVELI
jgi:molybdopterin molybdotransferase